MDIFTKSFVSDNIFTYKLKVFTKMKVYKIIFTYFPSGNFAMWSFVTYKFCDLGNFCAKVKIYL